MSDRVFIDTNILLYALTEPKEKDKAKGLPKRAKSLELLTKLYSEDMQYGLVVDGVLNIINPF